MLRTLLTKNTKRLAAILAVLLLVAGFAAVAAAGNSSSAVSELRGRGTATAIAEEGRIIIDGRGYAVLSTARVYDALGKKVRLGDLSLPTFVEYECRYWDGKPQIVLLREKAQ